MILNYLHRCRQNIAILMIPVFFADFIGLRMAQGASAGQTALPPAYSVFDSTTIAGENHLIPNESPNLIRYTPPAVDKQTAESKHFIGGPGQPEMQAFQSVNANNMVDLFTGDFSYNIPLLDVGGYPVGLSYRGGISMDQEASWVGLGWNINPGSIMRNVRGLPDDFNGKDSITKELNTKKKWSAGVNVSLSSEILGADLSFLKNLSPRVGIYYDSYTGPGFNAAITPGIDGGQFAMGEKTYGIDSANIGISFDSKSGFNLNPTYITTLTNGEGKIKGDGQIGLNYNSRAGLQALQVSSNVRQSVTQKKNGTTYSGYSGYSLYSSTLSFNSPTFTPTISMPTTFAGFTFSAKGGGEFFGFHGFSSISGFYNQSFIAAKDRTQKMPAYGYLHMSRSVNDQKALLDFNREKDIPYRKNTPNIGMPFQTYDVFSISGEGIGGSFRAYRGDAGIMRDHQVKNNSFSSNVGLEAGAIPNLGMLGADIRFTYAYTENRKWDENNDIQKNLGFRDADTTYEPVYFRNPGEQSSNSKGYYQSIGDEDLVRVKLTGNNYDPNASNYLDRINKRGRKSSMNVTSPIIRVNRDKKSQVISYLNAAEAALVGMEKDIRSYPVNSIPTGNCDSSFEKINRYDGVIRKSHHISQVNVLNPDGRTYIYGIPAYNLVQKEATFAVSSTGGDPAKGLVSYSSSDRSTDNDKGKDSYFNMQSTPAHAHSYLLTALLSADYSDVTGNGISEDDIGDAVKFNYTRMKWAGDYAFKWRTPAEEDKASYDEGMRTDNSDDKGHIVYGEKEIWYLNSLESKTMIATFKLDTDSLRKDGFEVKDIDGGRSTNPNKKLMRLKEINLYSKADLKKYGPNARPIKTVHFSYSYRLCKGYPDLQDTTTGKLTLESVWFTYNGSKKGKKNRYVFNYGENPRYQHKAYDRWGNYKPSTDNPGDISSDEYPYAIKDSTTAAKNAAAWALSDIILPSGAKMKVQYESDDYGYVQNKTACEMFEIAGFGSESSSTPSETLYDGPTDDKRFVFIKLTSKVADKKEILEKYLRHAGKLYFRLHVRMPEDAYGSGYEYVPTYADIDDYGRVNDSLIWIHLDNSPEGNKRSPLVTAALQFLRLNLPSKAYPGSDVNNSPAFVGAVQAVLSIVGETTKLLLGGFGNDARIRGKCRRVALSKSFVRLATPDLKKYGGGQRVKKITIHDNWQKMTGKKESIYGQEYNYTTTKVINGKKVVVSSGVASYEPSIGNEENPFRQPIEYQEKATLAPSNFLYVDEPFGESLFPSAGIGYSKIRVSSINRKNIKSASGFEETEFYTAFDFPTLTQKTQFDNDSHKKGIDKFNFFNLRHRKHITLSQGFKIELNDMHGKMKSSAVYAETDSVYPITYTAQYYRCEQITAESYRLLNTVPVIDSANGKIDMQGQIGKDIELITDMREQFSSIKSVGVKANVDNFVIPFFVPLFIGIPSIFPDISMENSRYRSVAMLKVVQRYGIIDSVVHIDKGSRVSTRNMVWDGETGQVLLTQTQNEFNDPIYQFQYPAHWAYNGVGPAYKNIDAVLKRVTISGGKVRRIDGSASTTKLAIVNRLFESGDEVLVTTPTFYFLEGCWAPVIDRPSIISPERKLWVVDKAKTSGGAKDLYFVDRHGGDYTGSLVDLRIIRSGRKNTGAAPVGSIVSLKTPIKTVDGNPYIVIDSTIDVVAAGAAVMKDVWSVEDRFYKVTQCDSSIKTIDTIIRPYTTALTKRVIAGQGANASEIENRTVFGQNLFTAGRNKDSLRFKSFVHYDRQSRGLMKFDFGFIPSHATLDTAVLNLYSKRPLNLWDNSPYWTTVNKAHTPGINQSALYQVVKSWDANTTLQQTDQIITQANSVGLPASSTICQDYSVNIKNMVNTMLQDPATNQGILMKLTYPDALDANLANHMSFCVSGDATRTSTSYTCDSCVSIGLRVKYTYRKDSCYDECKSLFTKKINPYVHGIWGNWRGSRSYVYYDRRRESDPLQPTNIRVQGVIRNFTPYWAMSSAGITATGNEYAWVWNSEITRVNRRGLETENHDPLGRFNSGLYGYNNTLPVAITQNARHRETAFDGFEDYSFVTDSCAIDCPLLRHLDFSAYKANIDSNQRHSGRSSLRLTPGSTATIHTKVLPGIDSLSPQLNFSTGTNGSCTYYNGITTSSGAVYPGFTPLPGKLMVVSAWAKEDTSCKCTTYTGNKMEFVFYQTGSTLNTVSVYPKGNIIEGWQRYDDTLRIPANADSMSIKLRNTSADTVYFDDFRLHPFNSNMKSFVYHPTNLRLLSELDENNYASFYEYDDEGTLIRVKKETERGVKTITETRSALRKTEE